MVRALVGLSVGVGLMALCGGTAAAQGTTTEKYLTGKIVRVDPATGVVVIRTGTGNTAKEVEYRTGTATKYYGENNKALNEGLKYSGWRPNTEVHYLVGPNATNPELSGMWLGPVPVAPPKR